LEFSHVFIVDTLRKPPTRLPWFVLEKGFGLRYREGSEILHNPFYSEALEAHRKLDAEESNRILYVALTRAKECLHIFLPEQAKLLAKNSWGEKLHVLYGVSKGKPGAS
jgi:ATP-dependent exoDNAse (exonuclease V) beta subunit